MHFDTEDRTEAISRTILVPIVLFYNDFPLAVSNPNNVY